MTLEPLLFYSWLLLLLWTCQDPNCALLDSQNEDIFDPHGGDEGRANDAQAAAQAGASFKMLGLLADCSYSLLAYPTQVCSL